MGAATDLIGDAVGVLRAGLPILVFTGAGISTESGIPDFRGPNGLWHRVDPDDFSLDRYLANPALRRQRWQMHLDRDLWSARSDVRPNPAHRAIVDLWKAGRLAGCVTQNVDGLHTAAGLPAEMVAELHGNVHTVHCVDCRTVWPTEHVLRRVEAGDDDPACEQCGGTIKTSIVMFGEAMPQAAMERARTMAAAAGSALVVGSTLSVYPAAEIPLTVALRGDPMVIVNLGPTDHDTVAAVKVDARAGEVLPALIAALAV